MNKDRQRVKKIKLLIEQHLKTVESMEDLKEFIKSYSKFNEAILCWDKELAQDIADIE
jgi:NADH/NAD ratio-sensing transcriptional regulator Rex